MSKLTQKQRQDIIKFHKIDPAKIRKDLNGEYVLQASGEDEEKIYLEELILEDSPGDTGTPLGELGSRSGRFGLDSSR